MIEMRRIVPVILVRVRIGITDFDSIDVLKQKPMIVTPNLNLFSWRFRGGSIFRGSRLISLDLRHPLFSAKRANKYLISSSIASGPSTVLAISILNKSR